MTSSANRPLDPRGQLDAMKGLAARVSNRSPLLLQHQQEAYCWAIDTINQFGGALLADDVGMGKTRVAAAVAAHYAGEGGIVAVIPPSLEKQWRETFALFSVEAAITSRHRLWNRSSTRRARLVVVDEAHFFRNTRTRGWAALRRLCTGARVLLVTATPFWNRARDIEALVSLFAHDGDFRCSGVASFSDSFAEHDRTGIGSVIGSVVLMRTRNATPARGGTIERRMIEWQAPRRDREISDLLETLSFPLMESTTHAGLVRSFLRLRLASSHEALAASLRRQRRYVERAAALARRGFRVNRSSVAISRDAPLFQELLFPDLFSGIDRSDTVHSEELTEELERVRNVESNLRSEPCRMVRLAALLMNRRVPTVIFAGAIETAEALREFLIQREFNVATVTSLRSWVLNERSGRENAIAAFTDGSVELLIATDLAGEGYDMRRAERIIHYDLPWSPVRLHQREGRAWRLDRRADSIEAIAFRVTGLGAGVDEILRRKEIELEALLRTESTELGDSSSVEPHPVMRVGQISGGAILQSGGRVTGWDHDGLVYPIPGETPILDALSEQVRDSDPAHEAFIAWLASIQEGRRRLPSRNSPSDPPTWPLDHVTSAIVSR